MNNNPDSKRPNILLILTDQERHRRWIPKHLTLPNRQRLIDAGLEFTSFYTHTSPCSPSRASLFTGLYLPQHGVVVNISKSPELDPSIPTLGHMLREAGYYTAYIGKWHLSVAERPDMEAYGFSDWEGNDRAFMGMAGTGLYYDPIIADQGARWLKTHAASTDDPWFAVVSLVNPHDVMWFPADQPEYEEAHPEEVARWREELPRWRDDGEPLPIFRDKYDEVFDTLPPNFDDDLHTKPPVQRQWLWNEMHRHGMIERGDKRSWLRKLDYYWRLHQESDKSVGTVLDALDASGRWDDTIVIFTSDHGDQVGSHGLRSKGPWVYEETMRIPLYVRVPGVTTPGAKTSALATHVDLAATIVSLAGISPNGTMPGMDLSPVLGDPSQPARESVLLAQDMPWFETCVHLRYAMRAVFDGRYKYARYYGVGGGYVQGQGMWPTPKLYDVDADFEDHDHEFYDLQEDPHELVNLADDRGRRKELRQWFERLRAEERKEFGKL